MFTPRVTSRPRGHTGDGPVSHTVLAVPLLLLSWILGVVCNVQAQMAPGEVLDSQFVTEFEGGFLSDLSPDDNFGRALAKLGDLNGDGIVELAVGAPNDDDGAVDAGAVWILSVRPNGQTPIRTKLSALTPGLIGLVGFDDHFGAGVGAAGDLDGDGTNDLLVGATGSDAAAFNGGTLWVVLMNADLTVKQAVRIDPTTVPLLPPFIAYTAFGIALATLGDLDGDGTVEIAVGASGDGPTLGSAVGAVFVLSLSPSLAVTSVVKFGGTAGGLPWALQTSDGFGAALCAPGDLDGDGVPDLAVHSNDQAFGTGGAVHLLYLAPDASVKGHTRIAGDGAAGFSATLGSFDNFADSLATVGDLDHDGVVDLAVGASAASGGFSANDGAVFVLFLAPNGWVKAHVKLAPGGLGGFAGSSSSQYQHFGRAVCPLGDFDGDGNLDLAVGMPAYPYAIKGGGFWGSLYTLRLTDGQWIELGGSLAGATGTPQLSGDGVPIEGRPVQLQLHEALPDALAFLASGLTQVNLSFKGGTLVPSPDLLTTLVTDGAGSAQFEAIWPAGLPVGTPVLFQSWIQDATGPAAWTASNGILVTTP